MTPAVLDQHNSMPCSIAWEKLANEIKSDPGRFYAWQVVEKGLIDNSLQFRTGWDNGVEYFCHGTPLHPDQMWTWDPEGENISLLESTISIKHISPHLLSREEYTKFMRRHPSYPRTDVWQF